MANNLRHKRLSTAQIPHRKCPDYFSAQLRTSPIQRTTPHKYFNPTSPTDATKTLQTKDNCRIVTRHHTRGLATMSDTVKTEYSGSSPAMRTNLYKGITDSCSFRTVFGRNRRPKNAFPKNHQTSADGKDILRPVVDAPCLPIPASARNWLKRLPDGAAEAEFFHRPSSQFQPRQWPGCAELKSRLCVFPKSICSRKLMLFAPRPDERIASMP